MCLPGLRYLSTEAKGTGHVHVGAREMVEISVHDSETHPLSLMFGQDQPVTQCQSTV